MNINCQPPLQFVYFSTDTHIPWISHNTLRDRLFKNGVAIRKKVYYVFVLGDKLPTMHEAAISIYSVSKKDSESRDKAVHAYAVALQDVWHKSFGEKHVIGLKPMKKRHTERYTDTI